MDQLLCTIVYFPHYLHLFAIRLLITVDTHSISKETVLECYYRKSVIVYEEMVFIGQLSNVTFLLNVD